MSNKIPKTRFRLVDQAETLSAGDYISYPGDQEHIFDALEENTDAIIIMEQVKEPAIK